jgi:hypothetical protein
MRASNPGAWARLLADAQLVGDNREAIDACRASLIKTGKAQHCAVTLTPNPKLKAAK